MTKPGLLARVFLQDDVNFLITNRIPRRLTTHFMGWFSRIEQPQIRDLSLAIWKRIARLDLDEARKSEFASMHDCFIRELKAGARPVDPDPAIVTSPCDAIIGASGRIVDDTLIQAKGRSYPLQEFLQSSDLIAVVRGGSFVTLRITSSMYHRFHAPHDCRVRNVKYVAGDAWNVNPPALARVDRLFCRNERAVIPVELEAFGKTLVLVPVAAILVASIRLHFLDVLLHLRHAGPNEMPCDARLHKGQEMGWFEHGSTIVVLAPPGIDLYERLSEGTRIRVGQPLLRISRESGGTPSREQGEVNRARVRPPT